MNDEQQQTVERRPKRVWWLWVGVFYCVANVISALIQFHKGDLFLFLLGTVAAVFVGQTIWDRRGYLLDPDEYRRGGQRQ